MTSRWCVLGLVLAVSLFSAGYLYGEQDDPQPADLSKLAPPERLAAAERLMELQARLYKMTGDEAKAKTARESADTVTAVLEQAARDPELSRAILDGYQWRYEMARSSAKSAPQACQVASETAVRLALFQAQQQRRIIELLEQLAKTEAAKK